MAMIMNPTSSLLLCDFKNSFDSFRSKKPLTLSSDSIAFIILFEYCSLIDDESNLKTQIDDKKTQLDPCKFELNSISYQITSLGGFANPY